MVRMVRLMVVAIVASALVVTVTLWTRCGDLPPHLGITPPGAAMPLTKDQGDDLITPHEDELFQPRPKVSGCLLFHQARSKFI